MRRIALLSCFIGTLCCAEIIPAERLPVNGDWTLAGVEGGIPIRDTIFTNLTSAATAAQINNAISVCPSNQVVKLGTGTFTVNAVISLATGVTLRGSGTNTILQSTLTEFNDECLVMMGTGSAQFWDGSFTAANETSWTAGYDRGETNLTVASAAGLSAGMLIGLDQSAGGIVNSTSAYIARDSGDRAQQTYRRVYEVDGTTVTIYPPLGATNWVSGESPELFWPSTTTIEWAGVEDLTIDNDDRSNAPVKIYNGMNCWVYNCKLMWPKRHHFSGQFMMFCELRRCILSDWSTFSSSFYGAEPWNASFICLEDNIAYIYANCFSWLATSYSVNANNFVIGDQGIGGSMSWNFFEHDGHCHHNLFEGNYGMNATADDLTANQTYKTLFRNRYTGYESGYTSGYCIRTMSDMWHHSVVGNVLGTSGQTTLYESDSQTTSIYCWDDGDTGFKNDPAFDSFLMHYNYDVITSTNNGIVLGGIEDTSPPASYAHSSKPEWWGDRPWPWVDPASPSTAVYTNQPAGYRFEFGEDPPAAGPSAATVGLLRIGAP